MRYENKKRQQTRRRSVKRRSGRRLFLESLDPRLVLTGSPLALAAVETDFLGEDSSQPLAQTMFQANHAAIQAEGEGTMVTSRLTVFANGQQISIPANIGVKSDTTTADVFTNSADGVLQTMSSTSATLGDFFDVWRTDAGLAGNNANAVLSATQLFTNTADTTHTVQMFVNGQISEDFGSHILQDGEEIILVYSDDPIVSLNTNFGSIVIELFETETPGTVNNFLNYVNDGDYINSFFHRSANTTGLNGLTHDFVIQGGGFRTTSTTFTSTSQFSSVPTDPPIQNEPGISNVRGTVAMAKTSDPNSATSQFFVNLHDENTFLDSSTNSGGFTVFGQVLDLRSSDEIAALPTRANPSPYGELPVSTDNQLVVIQSIVGRGEISGTQFNDTNRNGTRDTGETARAGATVYIDANNNGVLDPGELSTTTDSTGRYLFQVDPGTYRVRAQIDSGLRLTAPAASDSYSVTVQIGREVVDRNFGVAVDNNAPVTQADSYSVNEDAVLTVVVANSVLANDTSQTSSALTATVNTQPANGSLTLNSNGSFTYTPTLNFFGTDAFTYVATDGTNQSSPTTVTVTVNAQPDPPVAVADSITFSNSRTPRTLDLIGNDTSAPDGVQTLTITSVTQGTAGGTVTLNNGTVTYLAAEGFIGTDTFTYTIQDTDGLTSSATATLNVTAVANNSLSGFAYIDADRSGLRETGEVGVPGVQITLTGAGLTRTILTDTNGAYSFTELPSGTYQIVERQPTALLDREESTTVPNAVVSNDQISTIVLDGGQTFAENNFGELGIESQYLSIAWFFASSDSPTVMFRETVAMAEEMAGNMTLASTIRAGGTEVPDGSNSAPIANADAYSVNENGILSVVVASGVLKNDTDIDGDSLTAVVVTQPAHGTLNFSGNGSFTYTPTSNFFGTDTFTYRASDGTALSNTATVTITVNEVDSTNTFTLAENSPAGTAVGTVTPEAELGNPVVFEINDPSISPALQLAADDHFTGDPTAPVVLIEYMDLSCPHCKDIHPVLEQLESDFEGDLLVVRRHLLLFNSSTNSTVFPNSLAAARVAEAASRQGKFDEMVDLLFTNQADWNAASNPTTFFNQYAQQLGLNMTQFASDQTDPAIDARIQRDRDAAVTLGISSTPSFFINGQATANPGTIAAFTPVIQNEVDASDAAFRLNRETGQITVGDSAALDFETTPSFLLVVNATGIDGATSQVNVRIDLTNVNDVTPVAAADSYSVDENNTLTVATALGVLNNDTDGDGDSLTAQQVTAPTNGTLTLNADGSFTYTPHVNFEGIDSFTYTATDGTRTSATTTATITVNAINSAPLTNVDSYTLQEDGSLTVTVANGVLVNDSDPEGATLTAILVEAPEHGTLSLNSDGSFTYTPVANFSATDAFTYKASDGQRESGSTTVTLLVQGLEDAPVGVNDSYGLDQGGVLNVSAANGVLKNDSDVDADTLTAVLVSNPSNGTLTLNANGSFVYEPADTFVGTDTFTYHANDGFFDSNTVTVTITVNDINLAPIATADSYSVDEDAVLTVSATNGLLANDDDPDGDALTISVTSGAMHGTLALQNDGSFTYTPDADFSGTDTFTYRLNDGSLDSNAAIVTVLVHGINDLPSATPDTYSVPVDGSLIVNIANGVLSNDIDVDGDTLNATIKNSTTNGSLSFQSNGSFTYSPNATYHGFDSFTYVVADNTGESNEATVTIAVDTAPETIGNSYAVNEDETLTIDAAAGVLFNDSDVDDDPLTAIITTAPSNGVVAMNDDGSFQYQPNGDFNGTDTFSYVANDGLMNSLPTVVTITVIPQSDAPIAANDGYTTRVDQVLSVNAATGVLANDSDADGDSLTVTLQSSPTNGTVTLTGDGAFNYTPNSNFSGTDSFTYTASDGTLTSNAATVTISVALNDLVRIRLEAASTDGTPIDSISVGQSFNLNAYVEDIRQTPQGVFAAYLDVIYDSSLASVNGTIKHATVFSNGRSGNAATPGLIDEVGAFTQSTLGAGEALLFTVPFVANSVGTLDLVADAADATPAHDTLLLGINTAIPLSLLDFVSDSLSIVAANGEGEGSSMSDYTANVDEAFAGEDDWLRS